MSNSRALSYLPFPAKSRATKPTLCSRAVDHADPAMAHIAKKVLIAAFATAAGVLCWIALVIVTEFTFELTGYVRVPPPLDLLLWMTLALLSFSGSAFIAARRWAAHSPVVPVVTGYVAFALAWALAESTAVNGLWGALLLGLNTFPVWLAARAGARRAPVSHQCKACAYLLVERQRRCPECGLPIA